MEGQGSVVPTGCCHVSPDAVLPSHLCLRLYTCARVVNVASVGEAMGLLYMRSVPWVRSQQTWALQALGCCALQCRGAQ